MNFTHNNNANEKRVEKKMRTIVEKRPGNTKKKREASAKEDGLKNERNLPEKISLQCKNLADFCQCTQRPCYIA